MMASEIIKQLKESLAEAAAFFREDLAKLRTGRPSPAVVEDILVEVYGSKLRVKELASIRVPEPRRLVIEPWDRSVLEALAKALSQADLGTSPAVEENRIAILFPPLTSERRDKLVHEVSEKVERVRMQTRKARQESRDQAEALESTEGKDAVFRLKEEIDVLVKEMGDQIEDLARRKEEEIRNG